MDGKTVGFVSLGCPKATVDTERLLTRFAQEGIDAVDGDAEVTVVNTCGFIDAAREESMDTIRALVEEGRRVLVTGCLGKEVDLLRTQFPTIEHISGPADPEAVVSAVLAQTPERVAPIQVGPAGVKLTPHHYSYLKISEGCNHKCTFCIIPQLRGPLRSRRVDDVLEEADRLAEQGTKEVLLVAQDLSAYGLDLRYAEAEVAGERLASQIVPLARALGTRFEWVRLHYVYPYPHVDDLIPLMNDGLVLPYLDMPLQHAAPSVLKAMRRPAAVEKVLDRLRSWRERCPELAIRSTFIVGFPGETDRDFELLLEFLDEAQLDRVGCFTYSAVEGAVANGLAEHVPERDKLDRQEILLEQQAEISANRLAACVGSTLQVLVDETSEAGAVARSYRDAPEVDGVVLVDDGQELVPGEFAWVRITGATEHDLQASLLGRAVKLD